MQESKEVRIEWSWLNYRPVKGGTTNFSPVGLVCFNHA